jgi:hypothetical protein
MIFGGVCACVVTVAAVRYALKRPLRLTEVVLVLPGAKAIPGLDRLMTGADFTTPQGRGQVLSDLLGLLDEGDVRDGCVRFRLVSKSDSSHTAQGRSLYEERMRAAGLCERPASEVVEARASDPPSPECLLGILIPLPADEPLEEGGKATAVALLAALKRLPAALAPPRALYLYYAPDPGGQLTEQEALALLRSFREA